jgi:2-keto-3-deoxy-L-fuconate dehydrogenase
MKLQGKTVLVTAAGQGIGKASALAMAGEGADVWATDVNPALLASYDGVAGIQTAVLDVLDKAAIARTVADLPALDVLFNCAGFVHAGTVLDATDSDWEFAFNLNARAQFWMIHQHGQRLQQHQGLAEPVHLRQQQGGCHRSDQKCRRRLRRAGHSLQCDMPRHGRYPVAAGPD